MGIRDLRNEASGALSRRRLLELAGASAVVAACAPAAVSASAAPSAGSALPKLAKPEKTSFRVGNSSAALQQRGLLWLAQDKGFFVEEGLSDITIGVADVAALKRGEADAVVGNTIDVVADTAKGGPLRMVVANNLYSPNMIAVHKDIKTPKDLEGKPALLAASATTLDQVERLKQLKEAGFDLTGVNVKWMYDAKQSDSWVPDLLAGKLFMAPIFNRHRNAVVAAGFRLVVDTLPFGGTAFWADQAAIEKYPNTYAAFARVYIRALQFWKDPANKDYMLTKIAPLVGVTVTPAIRDAYEFEIRSFKPWDGGFDVNDMQVWIKGLLPNAPEVKTFIATGPLYKAQASLGLAPSPKV